MVQGRHDGVGHEFLAASEASRKLVQGHANGYRRYAVFVSDEQCAAEVMQDVSRALERNQSNGVHAKCIKYAFS
jgi:hypothetical protein